MLFPTRFDIKADFNYKKSDATSVCLMCSQLRIIYNVYNFPREPIDLSVTTKIFFSSLFSTNILDTKIHLLASFFHHTHLKEY